MTTREPPSAVGNTAKVIAVLTVLALSVAAVLPGSAMAGGSRRAPRVAWTFPKTGSEGQPITFSWSASHLGKEHILVVEELERNTDTWNHILRLHGEGGMAQLPAVALGHRRFRIADLVPVPWPHRGGHRGFLRHYRVVAKEASGIAIFGKVPFSRLFRSAEQVHATPDNTFSYVAHFASSGSSFTVEDNNCSTAHISFVGSGGRSVDGKAPGARHRDRDRGPKEPRTNRRLGPRRRSRQS